MTKAPVFVVIVRLSFEEEGCKDKILTGASTRNEGTGVLSGLDPSGSFVETAMFIQTLKHHNVINWWYNFVISGILTVHNISVDVGKSMKKCTFTLRYFLV